MEQQPNVNNMAEGIDYVHASSGTVSEDPLHFDGMIDLELVRYPKVERSNYSRFKHALVLLATVLAWFLIAIGAVALAGGRWIVKTFGYITPDQLRMNLAGTDAEGVGGDFTRSGVIEIAVIPLGVVLALFIFWLWVRRSVGRYHTKNSALNRTLAIVTAVVAIVVPVAGASSFGSAVQFREYLAANDPNLNVGDFYVEPTVLLEENDPRYNLVLIYLESIEDSLGREDVVGKDLLAGLDEVTGEWDRIPELEQYKNFGWTMAGFVGTQCGVPLRAASSEPIDESARNDAGILNEWDNSNYMESAVCLGDVLEDQGYKNVYMGAARASFAGKGTFLSSHGYEKIRAGEEWAERDDVEPTPGWWGPSDGTIMSLAEDQIVELRDSGEPFSLTLLTVDTHEPATPQPYCEITTDVEMESIVECSLAQVAQFLQFLDREGFMEDTVVVVMGDHLRMAGPLDDKLSDIEDRTVFNRIHLPDEKKIRVQRADQFSMFPTILEALGVRLEDGRAGLGVSAYIPDVKYGTLRSLSDEERQRIIASRSQEFYDSLWDLPTTDLASTVNSN